MITDTNNRVRQARRLAGLTQQGLATRVGVHRSAVAQWEQASGSLPTIGNFARIAMTTSVSFEWLATGRGRMKFTSDILGTDESPVALLEYSAQSESEVRALTAMRKLGTSSVLAVVDLLEALAEGAKLKLNRRTPYSR